MSIRKYVTGAVLFVFAASIMFAAAPIMKPGVNPKPVWETFEEATGGDDGDTGGSGCEGDLVCCDIVAEGAKKDCFDDVEEVVSLEDLYALDPVLFLAVLEMCWDVYIAVFDNCMDITGDHFVVDILVPREKGKPGVKEGTFNVGAGGGYLELAVVNEMEKPYRVTSALVEIDGERVLSPDDFNQNVKAVKKSVFLLPGEHTYKIEVRGKPGVPFALTAILGPPGWVPESWTGEAV